MILISVAMLKIYGEFVISDVKSTHVFIRKQGLRKFLHRYITIDQNHYHGGKIFSKNYFGKKQ